MKESQAIEQGFGVTHSQLSAMVYKGCYELAMDNSHDFSLAEVVKPFGDVGRSDALQ